jgi:hypothetical protein
MLGAASTLLLHPLQLDSLLVVAAAAAAGSGVLLALKWVEAAAQLVVPQVLNPLHHPPCH